MNNEDVYVIFLDIDGTLMSGGELVAENVTAIKKAQKRGHKVFINTGRSYSFIPWKKLADIRFDGVCAGCGSHVVIGDKTLRSVCVDREFLKKTVRYYKENDRCIFFEGESRCFWVNPHLYHGSNSMFFSSDLRCQEIKCAEQIDSEFFSERISKFTFWESGITSGEKALWGEQLRVIEHPSYTESVMYGCNKAVAIECVLRYLDIPRERSIAMGDSKNDMEMLEYAGISVSMGNATDEVKKMCDYVSVDASHGGVAKAIYELLSIDR